MNTKKLVESIVENVFQGEFVSTTAIATYITGNGVLFGICEESEDLTILNLSYEY